MWKKDNKIFSNPLVYNGRKIFNPKDQQLIDAGFVWEEPSVPVPSDPEPKKYSTLKIIRQLGDNWSNYRKMLEEAGVLDQFFAANYLREDDPVFVAFMQTIPEELSSQLENCIWEEN